VKATGESQDIVKAGTFAAGIYQIFLKEMQILVL
jgi:hypothetical protein